MNDPSLQIPALIKRAIEEETARIIDDEMKGISERVERRVRSEVGSIAARVLERFSMERRGHDLCITVKFESPEKP